jgi:hypothetical protein
MSLRIRRGTDLQRQSITFDPGEVVYTTDTKKLFIGDGATAGGVNVLATMAGSSVVYNSTTNALDFNPSGLTTTNIAEGNNLYYTSNRAKDAAAQIFTAAGSPTASGTITNTTAPSRLTVNSTVGLVQGERIVISGGGLSGGLTAGTYYVCAVTDSTHITISTTQANALAGTAITSFTTATISGTWTAGGTDTGITFVYDNINRVMNVTSNGLGITSVSQDTSPQLGGNLSLNSRNITGTGNININGSVTASSVTANSITSTASIPAGFGLVSSPIYLGSNTTPNSLVTYSAGQFAVLTGLTNGSVTSSITSRISRGSLTSPTTVLPGDATSLIQGQAYDGTNYVDAGGFGVLVDPNSTVSTGNVSGVFVVVLPVSGGISVLSFDTKGVLSVPVVQTGSFTTTTRNALTPAVGMMIYNTTTNKFQGYQNTGGTTPQWVDLS